MKVLKQEGFGADCSSYPELLLAEEVGLTGEAIMFTSNDTQAYEFQKAVELGAIINLDDITHIEYLEKCAGIPELVCFRYNPGPLKEGNVIIGKPEDAKYGFTREQLFEGYKILRDKGVKRFGLHTMVASNELDYTYFIETANSFELVAEISTELGIEFDFVNIGGGIGIPYRPEQDAVNLEKGRNPRTYEEIIVKAGLKPLKLLMECGRQTQSIRLSRRTRFTHQRNLQNIRRPRRLYGELDAPCSLRLISPHHNPWQRRCALRLRLRRHRFSLRK